MLQLVAHGTQQRERNCEQCGGGSGEGDLVRAFLFLTLRPH